MLDSLLQETQAGGRELEYGPSHYQIEVFYKKKTLNKLSFSKKNNKEQQMFISFEEIQINLCSWTLGKPARLSVAAVEGETGFMDGAAPS